LHCVNVQRSLPIGMREGVTISMDGRGRAFDNIFVERLWRSVKHKDVYLNGCATMGELLVVPATLALFWDKHRNVRLAKLSIQRPDGYNNQPSPSPIGAGASVTIRVNRRS
jgi:hypothetical protein